ncbi:MAG: L-serine ammonia-lyase, iron-sulfur-dependent, subunit alpha [Oscillospiraceae bacterium]|nr:L-serine ammonia-lyase, iron-sulfur-dependent, subunit alpha [Oscillospiraceae bacterium]
MYTSLKDLLRLTKEQNAPLWQIMLDNECALAGCTPDEIWNKLRDRYAVMKKSATKALTVSLPTAGNLISGITAPQYAYSLQNGTICGNFINYAMALALSGSEVNASMGKVCAAPTAGACGILPAVLLAMAKEFNYEEDDILKALLTASGIGAVVVKNATVAGAEGGCQAECGVAAAMAAAAAVQLKGGTPQQAVTACCLVFMNVMGLICDPVAGLVQVPCAQRNASQTINALLCADLALAGMQCIIDPDDVIEAMYKVGKMLPVQLRETALGGIAATHSSKKIQEEIFSNS